MAATTQVQILVRTDGSAKALRAPRVGPRPALGVGRLSSPVCAAELHDWHSRHHRMCMPLLRSGRGNIVLPPLNLAGVASAERAFSQIRIV